MLENPDFEQDQWSRTAEGIHKIGHDFLMISINEMVNFFTIEVIMVI